MIHELNHLVLQGVIARAPEIKVQDKGNTASFGLEHTIKTNMGTTYPLMMEIRCWSSLADQCECLSIGDSVVVSGRLAIEKSRAKNNLSIQRIVIMASSICRIIV